MCQYLCVAKLSKPRYLGAKRPFRNFFFSSLSSSSVLLLLHSYIKGYYGCSCLSRNLDLLQLQWSQLSSCFDQRMASGPSTVMRRTKCLKTRFSLILFDSCLNEITYTRTIVHLFVSILAQSFDVDRDDPWKWCWRQLSKSLRERSSKRIERI